MNENNDLLPNLLHEEFEMQMRGYSRRQVDDYVARRNNEIRDLEQRLSRAIDENEHLRRELASMRQQALGGRPAHEEVSERIAQILKLADDEAKAQKGKAEDEITRLRSDAQQESEQVRTDAREQAERMLTAAQEQAERTISAARADADKTRTSARAESDRLTNDTRKKADAALANAKAQAKKVLDEATARATAIHDGAERRLNLLSNRHAETVRRLTDILDGVSGLVAAENARPSLEEEVAQSVNKTVGSSEAVTTDEAGKPASAAGPGTPGTGAADSGAQGASARPARQVPEAGNDSPGSGRPAATPNAGPTSGAPRPETPPATPRPGTPQAGMPRPGAPHPAAPRTTTALGGGITANQELRPEPGRPGAINPDEPGNSPRLMPNQ
jgi:cell division septum initiation protein DivIVA